MAGGILATQFGSMVKPCCRPSGEVFVDQMTEENIGRPDLFAFAKRVDGVRDEEREKKAAITYGESPQ